MFLITASLLQGMVEYESCMEMELTIGEHDGGPSITEVLYRNKNSLETIFRAMDKDHSGNHQNLGCTVPVHFHGTVLAICNAMRHPKLHWHVQCA